VAAAALRQFLLLETRHGAEMLADSVQWLDQMHTRRKLFGEQVLQIAKQCPRLRVPFNALALRLSLAPLRDRFDGIQALGDCYPIFMRQRRRRHLSRLPADVFSVEGPSEDPTSQPQRQAASQKEVASIATTAAAITAVASQPSHFSKPTMAKRPIMSLRAAISIIVAMTGTATMPLSTALQ
jgi:hypothetical protein